MIEMTSRPTSRSIVRPRAQGSEPNTPAHNRLRVALAMALGEQLLEWRRTAGLTQKELGDLLGGLTPPQISKWEHGKDPVNDWHIPAYADALGVPRSVFTKAVMQAQNPVQFSTLFGEETDNITPIRMGRKGTSNRLTKKR